MAVAAKKVPKGQAALAEDLWTAEQLSGYLVLVGQGVALDVASAEALEATATKVGHVIQRDAAFRERFEAARKEGMRAYRRELRQEARRRKDTSDRFLEVELGTYVAEADEDGPGYGHLRRDRVKHEGTIQHEHMLMIDLSKLDAMPLDRLKALEAELQALAAGEVVEGEGRELAAGE